MSFRTTAVLAVLVLVLGGIFYFTEIRGGKPDPDPAKRLFTAKADEVEGVDLRTDKATIALRRGGDGWRLEKPLETRGDNAAIAALVSSLVAARAERKLEVPPKDPADFGLDKPDLTVRFRVKGDSQWRTLELGGKNPTGSWAYARVDGKPEVILVPETLRGELSKTPLDLRDKTVMDVQVDKVTRLIIRRGTQPPVELQKSETWEMVKPVKARADDWRASGLVRMVADLKAKDFAAEPATDLKAYGLDAPAVRVELWERDAKAPKVLALTSAKDKPNTLYARDEAGRTVVALDPAILNEIPAAPWEIRDKSLFRYNNKDVKRVRLGTGDKTVAVEREGENVWKVVEPAPGPADEPRVTDLLFKLTGLRVDGVAAEQTDAPARYGLDKPELAVTVIKTDGKDIGTLLIGREEKDQRYVQMKGEAPVYTIPAKDLQDLPRVPDDLREKKPQKKI